MLKSDGRVPSSWKNASVVLIHKKGDKADVKNYRPISLLPVIYKVFSNILLQRMLQALEQHQPQEQAGFRPGFSTTDHIHVVSQLREKANEYKIPRPLHLCWLWESIWLHQVYPTFHSTSESGSWPSLHHYPKRPVQWRHINTEAPQGQQQDQPRERIETRW